MDHCTQDDSNSTSVRNNTDLFTFNQEPTINQELTFNNFASFVVHEGSPKAHFFSSPIVVAGAVMSVHYRTIMSMYGGFPIVLAEGPTETGKSIAMKAGLSLLGMSKTWFYVEGTNRFFLSRDVPCHPCHTT